MKFTTVPVAGPDVEYIRSKGAKLLILKNTPGFQETRTMTFINQFLAVVLSCLLASAAFAERSSNVFTKVRYNGGSVPSKVDPKEWGNKQTVRPRRIGEM